MEALHCLKSASSLLFLSPSTSPSQTARSASLYLFFALLPSRPKSPFDRLLVEGFDAKKIWHQIDLQTKPLIANLGRDVKRLEANPGDIMQAVGGKSVGSVKREEKEVLEEDGGEQCRDKADEEGEGSEEEDEDIAGFDEEDDEEGDEEEEKDEGVMVAAVELKTGFLRSRNWRSFWRRMRKGSMGLQKRRMRMPLNLRMTRLMKMIMRKKRR